MSIATFFSREDIRRDPANHCVPVLDVFADDIDSNISYLVMPFLRDIYLPPFESVGDVISFADQMLEVMRLVFVKCHRRSSRSQGLVFMHKHGIAHRYAKCMRSALHF